MTTEHAEIPFFADIIEKELGIVYRIENYYQLETRLKEIVKQMGFTDIKELHARCQDYIPSNVKMLLLDLATNNETSFYRDKEVFSSLSNEILQQEIYSKRPVKIWSAACSTGQEPYTLAMVLKKWQLAGVDRQFSIYATDYSDRVLKQTQSGLYSTLEVQRGMPTTELLKWFKQVEVTTDLGSNERWQISEDLRKHVSTCQQNLLKPLKNSGPFDIIFCRNVMIYFSVSRKKEIIEKLYQSLNPGGYVVLGAAESMIGLNDNFKSHRIGRATFFKKETSMLK